MSKIEQTGDETSLLKQLRYAKYIISNIETSKTNISKRDGYRTYLNSIERSIVEFIHIVEDDTYEQR